jgi:hypothetical protein
MLVAAAVWFVSEGRLAMKSKLGAALAAGVNALLTILLAASFLFVVLYILQQLLRSQLTGIPASVPVPSLALAFSA